MAWHGVGLHGVAQRESERCREGERGAGGGLERGAVVDVARRAEALADLGGRGRGEEHGRGYPVKPSRMQKRAGSSAGARRQVIGCDRPGPAASARPRPRRAT